MGSYGDYQVDEFYQILLYNEYLDSPLWTKKCCEPTRWSSNCFGSTIPDFPAGLKIAAILWILSLRAVHKSIFPLLCDLFLPSIYLKKFSTLKAPKYSQATFLRCHQREWKLFTQHSASKKTFPYFKIWFHPFSGDYNDLSCWLF